MATDFMLRKVRLEVMTAGERGEAGRDRLCGLLAGYPGVALLASDISEVVDAPTRRWVVD